MLEMRFHEREDLLLLKEGILGDSGSDVGSWRDNREWLRSDLLKGAWLVFRVTLFCS